LSSLIAKLRLKSQDT